MDVLSARGDDGIDAPECGLNINETCEPVLRGVELTGDDGDLLFDALQLGVIGRAAIIGDERADELLDLRLDGSNERFVVRDLVAQSLHILAHGGKVLGGVKVLSVAGAQRACDIGDLALKFGETFGAHPVGGGIDTRDGPFQRVGIECGALEGTELAGNAVDAHFQKT